MLGAIAAAVLRQRLVATWEAWGRGFAGHGSLLMRASSNGRQS